MEPGPCILTVNFASQLWSKVGKACMHNLQNSSGFVTHLKRRVSQTFPLVVKKLSSTAATNLEHELEYVKIIPGPLTQLTEEEEMMRQTGTNHTPSRGPSRKFRKGGQSSIILEVYESQRSEK